jgi:hypothetical protein
MAARPTTSRSVRPATSRGDLDPMADTLSDRDPQYTYSQEYSLEDEGEESDDGDVFAFLPPSTPQHSSTQPPAQSPLQSYIPSPHSPLQAPPAVPPQHPYLQHFPADLPSPTSPPPPFSTFSDPLVYPPPAFIPQAAVQYIPEAGPSTTSVHFVGTVDSPSPPSTAEQRDSDFHSIEDGFRLRKLGSLPTAVSTATGFTTTSSNIPVDVKRRTSLFHEKRQPSTALSDISTIDPELDGAESASITCLYTLSILLLSLTRPQDEV